MAPPRIDPVIRFGEKFTPGSQHECWIWRGTIGSNGYGRLWVNNRAVPAHRFSYELLHGPVASELFIDHLCRTPLCVNPDHLEAVPPRINTLRGVSVVARNAVKTHCLRGHPFSGSNLYLIPRGGRACKKCNSARTMAYERQKRIDVRLTGKGMPA